MHLIFEMIATIRMQTAHKFNAPKLHSNLEVFIDAFTLWCAFFHRFRGNQLAIELDCILNCMKYDSSFEQRLNGMCILQQRR